MKSIIVLILNFLARLYIVRFNPRIVGITGSVGKTSTKEAIYSVLKNHFRARASASSYNNEFGLPLTILGLDTPGKNLFKWLLVFLQGIAGLFNPKYPQVLVLEMGADREQDIKKLLAVTGPIDVAVITDIGMSHLENYPSQQSLVHEKLSILKGLKLNGTAVLNVDNEYLKEAEGKVRNQKISYSMAQSADIYASDVKILKFEGEVGVNFKVHNGERVVPYFLPNSLGVPNVYAAMAASCVALVFKFNLVNASQDLKNFTPPPGRLRWVAGIKQTSIIDDTYNSAPSSAIAALSVLNEIATGRKVVVMGDMAELGSKSEEGHRQVGVKIQEIGAGLVVAVGEKFKAVVDELEKRKFSGKVLWFENSDAARMSVQNEIVLGDTILVKGSQSARMEKIVKEIMADPMDAEKLLVRQSNKWLNK